MPHDGAPMPETAPAALLDDLLRLTGAAIRPLEDLLTLATARVVRHRVAIEHRPLKLLLRDPPPPERLRRSSAVWGAHACGIRGARGARRQGLG